MQLNALILDLNYHHVWVADKQCRNCDEQKILTDYDGSQTQGCTNNKTLTYKSLILNTVTCEDQFSQTELGLFNLNFQLVKSVSKKEKQIKRLFNGVFGLGFQKNNINNSFLDNLKKYQIIQKKEFSFSFEGYQLNLQFGGMKELQDQGEWHICELVENRGWTIKVNYFSFSAIDDENEQRSSTLIILFNSQAIFDVNIHGLELEYFNIKCYESHFIKGIYSCDNNNFDQYPFIELQMCGERFRIPPKDYLVCEDGCRLGISPITQKQISIGRVFLKKYYFHFVEEHPKKIEFVLKV